MRLKRNWENRSVNPIYPRSKRPQTALTNTTRLLLARFFKVHPGHLVDDPAGYHAELTSDLRAVENRLDLWIVEGAESFTRDPELRQSLLVLAGHPDTRKCLLLLRKYPGNPVCSIALRSSESGAGAKKRTSKFRRP